ELKRLAATDPLTGIPNRRAFETALNEAWRHGAHWEAPLSLLTVDIDAFKDYNEWYGPSLGDRCLTAVAQCLAKQMQRESDLATRYNG
ncbi:GGDEF domain-containing protein, partial [Acinetobacter baumannii]